jgi:hypothetical protein
VFGNSNSNNNKYSKKEDIYALTFTTNSERDSMGQARLPISDVAAVVKALVQQKCTWEQLIKKYGLFVFAGDSR